MIRHVRDKANNLEYDCLAFICPGCVEMENQGSGLHMLPVNTDKKAPSWTWDGNLNRPTISPSILTKYRTTEGDKICHSFLEGGVFRFLDDCTHSLKGKLVGIPNLPDWFVNEE